MEEYVLPGDYALPVVDEIQPQVNESTHRWSASSLWRDHKNKIIGGVVGGVAVAGLAVAGGVAARNNRRERAWDMSEERIWYSDSILEGQERAYVKEEGEYFRSGWWDNDDDGGNWDAFDERVAARKAAAANMESDFERLKEEHEARMGKHRHPSTIYSYP